MLPIASFDTLTRDIKALEGSLTRDIKALEAATKSDLARLEERSKRDLAEAKVDIVKWVAGMLVAQSAIIIGAMFALFRFFL
ncbi:MAG: DUF1640 domain-containing protein [Magnetococcales bacterium]|nr:DUF1640 domain-containing protein [Magnetococcales bacterium]